VAQLTPAIIASVRYQATRVRTKAGDKSDRSIVPFIARIRKIAASVFGQAECGDLIFLGFVAEG